jgi:FMN phosphatase YigB (HAD superfamily)
MRFADLDGVTVDAFSLALDLIGVSAQLALHIGDGETDELGAAAAGLHFAGAPLPHAVASLA